MRSDDSAKRSCRYAERSSRGLGLRRESSAESSPTMQGILHDRHRPNRELQKEP